MSLVSVLGIILAILLGAVALAAIIFLIGKIFGFTFLVLGNLFRFIGAEVTDAVRFVSSVLAGLLFAPLVVLSIVIGRWSASRHYAGSFMDEMHGAARCVYRFFVGNPARLLGLGGALEGIERRVPQAIAAAPTSDKPSSRRVGMFEGYKIVGSLKGGGSGGKLYIAEPDEVKRAVFAKRKLGEVDQVVIKVFSLKDGSSLPQIVRESRALDAARQLGLVLEHEMTPDRFFYVMRYVPGEPLSVVTQRMHTLSPGDGLGDEELARAMGYMRDLLVALDTYHNAELWHKDVKPDNIIIDGSDEGGRAHLVDFGLVTPMRSAMTLTTHGTEYFRDPELVRQALRGVKVHQIDGSKFDVYAAGAVLYSMIENSFPAHGGLSQITKRCPEALRWIVRRAMAEYDRRYPSAAAMLADLRVVLDADDPFALKPIDLPSVAKGDAAAEELVDRVPAPEWDDSVRPDFARRAGSPVPPPAPAHAPRKRVARPKAATDFWSGRYRVAGVPVATPQHKGKHRGNRKARKHGVPTPPPMPQRRPLRDPSERLPAREQVASARKRAQLRRANAAQRIRTARVHRGKHRSDYSNTPGAAVVFASLFGLAVLFASVMVGGSLLKPESDGQDLPAPVIVHAPDAPLPPEVIDTPDIRGIEQHLASVQARVEAEVRASLPDQDHGHTLHEPVIDASLLLVPMLPQPVEPQLLQRLDRGLREMEAHGIAFVGAVLPADGDEQAIELTARLQNAIGSVPNDAAEYPIRVQRWLGEQDLDGVLLLLTRPGDRQHAMLVTKRFHTDVPLDDAAMIRLMDALAQNGYAGQD